MIVLGIDPGLANTGYGVVARRGGRLVALDGGVVQTAADASVEQRLGELHEALSELLLASTRPPQWRSRRSTSAPTCGPRSRSARRAGSRCCAPASASVECFSYTPQQVKGAVCGNGRAPKEQVARMVTALLALGREPASDHASDALAVAICHANHAPLARALAAAAAMIAMLRGEVGGPRARPRDGDVRRRRLPPGGLHADARAASGRSEARRRSTRT